MMVKYVVRKVEFGGDVDGTGPERWLGEALAEFGNEAEAEAFVNASNEWCEIEVAE
jgi:hypothetical protein